MLIRFAFENFKSFAGRAELNMEAHRADKTLPGAVVDCELGEGGELRLLPAAAIYGATAAGKSTILEALRHFQFAVTLSQTTWQPGAGTDVKPHASKGEEPSEFEVELVAGGVRYRYGCRANASHFIDEWLYSYPKKRERLIFERRSQVVDGVHKIEVEVGNGFEGGERDREAFKRRTRENSLFLSACAQDNQPQCQLVQGWFRSLLQFSAHQHDWQAFTSAICAASDDTRKAIVALLRSADSGLSDIEIEEGDGSGAPWLPPGVSEDIIKFTKERLKHEAYFVMQDGDQTFRLSLDDQSDGVRRLYVLGWAINAALQTGAILTIDELEGSMHPHIAAQILALFQSRSSNPNGAQLIFSTHDTNLLDIRHLRRDQIWFVEKQASRSHLYPLLDFAPRKDENLETGYLRGRYGAIPALGLDPDWLKGTAPAAAE